MKPITVNNIVVKESASKKVSPNELEAIIEQASTSKTMRGIIKKVRYIKDLGVLTLF